MYIIITMRIIHNDRHKVGREKSRTITIINNKVHSKYQLARKLNRIIQERDPNKRNTISEN